MATEQKLEQAGNGETVASVLCTKYNWTPDDRANWRSIAFREDGVGCLKLLSDGPGTLLVCEFDWEFNEDYNGPGTAEKKVDTRQEDLEDSLRTRQIAEFAIDIKFRNSQPREEFGFGSIDIEAANSRRLKETAYEQETFFVRLEVGNFPAQHDTNPPDSEAYGKTRWAQRLSFQNKSPIPPRDRWRDSFQGMLEAMNWEIETNWFSHKLRGD
ncbi:hypothetical protein M406DRAFT_355329 [Cryphonectria parasitica EP155]|uniref:Uncharacterized protein n=1 Tax=Cryphonectria parasitica (strain ATCC 38755 / EP155) TaxID=660469 RepID=A0A9P5CR27_CRYP1|nr:uncharacterized protein M406DRAFT_355329 [Cryphonectria parasitica EP155]KAF3766685.1 hypothetical protein M406DRAFT_355329 [Cryphonectria parasitica EP155]